MDGNDELKKRKGGEKMESYRCDSEKSGGAGVRVFRRVLREKIKRQRDEGGRG